MKFRLSLGSFQQSNCSKVGLLLHFRKLNNRSGDDVLCMIVIIYIIATLQRHHPSGGPIVLGDVHVPRARFVMALSILGPTSTANWDASFA